MLAILITLDCVRADHVHDPAVATPSLDAFRREAVTFSRAHAHANTTLPSHITMMTGKLMPEHGVVHNLSVPGEGHAFLTERLAAMGVPCGGFVSVQFMDHLYASLMGARDRFFDVPRSRIPRALLRRMGLRDARRGAEKTAQHALRWIQRNASGDAFCWMHLFDTHMDYRAPEPWRRHYNVPETSDGEDLAGAVRERGWVSFHPLEGERRPLEYYPLLYKASISATDAVLGSFFDSLKRMGLYEDALIVVTGDHGESLMEHDVYCGHALLFDETIRVPLLVKFPGKHHAGDEVRSPVGHRDLMPTVLRHFGLTHLPERCHDLGSYLGGGQRNPDRPLFAFHNKMTQACVRKGSWLYVENLSLDHVPEWQRKLYGRTGLFDHEGRKADAPDVEAGLRDLIHVYLDQCRCHHDPGTLEEQAIKSHLEDLGYL
jgi:arylsulfatase A-like enzyme